MASVLEKVEILQSVGAEGLADQALTKIMQIEIDRLKQEQQRLQTDLTKFESTYQMTSEACQQKFEAGELGDAVEFFEWKYRHHWQDQTGRLIKRWDNAPHYPHVPSFPHHLHDGAEANVVEHPPVDALQILHLVMASMESSIA